MMNNSRTEEDLYTMVDSVHRPSITKERHRRHSPSIQALPSLMAFLDKESQHCPSSPTRINTVSILSGV